MSNFLSPSLGKYPLESAHLIRDTKVGRPLKMATLPWYALNRKARVAAALVILL